jgi:hypothetical protein
MIAARYLVIKLGRNRRPAHAEQAQRGPRSHSQSLSRQADVVASSTPPAQIRWKLGSTVTALCLINPRSPQFDGTEDGRGCGAGRVQGTRRKRKHERTEHHPRRVFTMETMFCSKFDGASIFHPGSRPAAHNSPWLAGSASRHAAAHHEPARELRTCSCCLDGRRPGHHFQLRHTRIVHNTTTRRRQTHPRSAPYWKPSQTIGRWATRFTTAPTPFAILGGVRDLTIPDQFRIR